MFARGRSTSAFNRKQGSQYSVGTYSVDEWLDTYSLWPTVVSNCVNLGGMAVVVLYVVDLL